MVSLSDAAAGAPAPLHPVLAQFDACVLQDPALFALVGQMFEQVPRTPPFDRDPTGHVNRRPTSPNWPHVR